VEIDRFLSLPIEDIVTIFRDAVKHLVASSTPPTDPPTLSPTPSTSKSAPSISLPTENVPVCPITFTDAQLDGFARHTDAKYLDLARTLKEVPNRKKGVMKSFLDAHSVELIAASIKQLVLVKRPPPK